MKKRIIAEQIPSEAIKTIRRVHATVDKKRMKIGLLKMGGLGDALTLKAFTKKVREKYPDAFITVITRGFEDVWLGRNYVDHIINTVFHWRRMYHAVKDEFDLFYDVGYVIRTIYNRFNERKVWEQLHAMNRELDFHSLWENFPFSNKRLEDYQMTIFEMMNMSSGIQVTEDDLEIVTVETALPKGEYVTLHNGAGGDANVKIARMKTFTQIAQYLKKNGVIPAQIGYKQDQKINKSVNYMGLPLLKTAYLIQNARFHIDCESGTVYVAKAVKTPSIVLFGATPISCFGFKGNINVSRNRCRACWWWNDNYYDNWYKKCRLGCSTCKNIPLFKDMIKPINEMMENT